MATVIVSARDRPDGDVGFEARRVLGRNDPVVPPGEVPGPVSIVIPECPPSESRRIVATWLDLHLLGWDQRLDLAVE
jgi:hypothetical protein